ncbi:alpha/beta-hydrolase [Teratosphaeria nubilosa]|uniref:Alpha/beta-hydrolase n=1 Tax=Teratosphaeria nubilosa TaxID=161662 RepID=A0A6G1L1N2_9PEZI|nr:alpha/beta-hydrolase [Teratosphaeria nubilosa]
MTSPQLQTIIYKTVGKVEIPFDLYLPSNAKNVPIFLWFHGGGLLQGIRNSVSPHMLRAVETYNIALVSADYRLAPQVGVAEIYEDVKEATAFIRDGRLAKQVGDGILDTSRLAVSGSSAGGYLAFLAGLYLEPKPKVILPIYPITDPLGTFFTTSQPHRFGGGRTDPSTLSQFIDPSAEVAVNNPADSKRNGMYFYMMQEANLAELLRIKPGDDTFRVAKKIYERGLPPCYVVHGDADSAVGVEQADEVVGVIYGLRKERGLEVEYERMRGVNHLFDREEKVEMKGMYEFMMRHL